MAREKLEEPHPVDIHVGRRVQEKRLGLGLTQSALARALGVSFQQVQKYEKGTNRVSASKLFEMADFMKVEIPYFFSGFRVAQAGVGEEEAPAFDHEPRMTKHSVEIARLAPHLPLRNQKLILDMMREMLGLETTEICAELGITPNNCHVTLHRARTGLRACLEGHWFTPGARPSC